MKTLINDSIVETTPLEDLERKILKLAMNEEKNGNFYTGVSFGWEWYSCIYIRNGEVLISGERAEKRLTNASNEEIDWIIKNYDNIISSVQNEVIRIKKERTKSEEKERKRLEERAVLLNELGKLLKE